MVFMNGSSAPWSTGRAAEEEEEDGDVEGGRARCEWDFFLSAVVSPCTAGRGVVTDALGAVEFDPTDRLLATGGIARKIRIYGIDTLAGRWDCGGRTATPACRLCICTPAKLSSIRWKPSAGGRVLAVGDYDGTVAEYDLDQPLLPTYERDEHGGRRVRSVDYTRWEPVLGASGSDDSSLQVWDPRCDGGETVAAVRPGRPPGSPVCCVEFSPFGGPLILAGCSDRRAYGYDIRMMDDPVVVLGGHRRPVTYTRFLDAHTVATAATDGSLKQWDLHRAAAIRTHRGHANARNFVGLAAWGGGGLLGCGSETNQVFVYDRRWGDPIWASESGLACHADPGEGFVGGVCLRGAGEDSCALATGGSDGVLRVFRGTRLARPEARRVTRRGIFENSTA